MKVMRYVNGAEVEFELTYAELHEAHNVWQESCDREDILNAFEDMTDNDLMETYGKTREEIEPLVNKMVWLYRKYMDNCDDWILRRDNAIEDVLDNLA